MPLQSGGAAQSGASCGGAAPRTGSSGPGRRGGPRSPLPPGRGPGTAGCGDSGQGGGSVGAGVGAETAVLPWGK